MCPPQGSNVSVLVERVGDSFGAMLQLTVDHRMLIPHKMLTRSVLIAVVVLRLVTTATIVTRGQDSRTRRGAGGSRAMVRYLSALLQSRSPCQFNLLHITAFYNDHGILNHFLRLTVSQWQGTACEEQVQVVRPVVAQNTRGQIMILDTGEGERAEVRGTDTVCHHTW